MPLCFFEEWCTIFGRRAKSVRVEERKDYVNYLDCIIRRVGLFFGPICLGNGGASINARPKTDSKNASAFSS